MTTESVPWDQHPSIYQHVRAHVRQGRPGLADGWERLPDDERANAGSAIRFAPGAADGIHTHHFGGEDDDEAAGRLLDAVRAYADAPTVGHKLAAYELLTAGRVIALIDPFMERLSGLTDVNWARVHELARSFATEAPDREPVKWAVAVLGPFAQPEDLDVLLTLGRHDEFTLFSAVAVARYDDALAHLWELARNASGWGRVHAVERITAADVGLPEEVKDWLLRQGYRNGVMYEYLALPCATAGDLRLAITRAQIDDGLLVAAGEIIDALFAGGPAPGIDAYDDAPAAVDAYLRHAAARSSPPLAALLTARTVRDFLADPEADWDARPAGWTPALRSALAAACDEFLGRPQWPARIAAGLRSPDAAEFNQADQAAGVLGIETWEVHWARLRQDPLEPSRWYDIMKHCDATRIDEVLTFAEREIPLDRVATGPGTELGLGAGFEPHVCLGYVLQELPRFPGRGRALIATGLSSPVLSNRNVAAKVLSDWGERDWPTGLRDEVVAARDGEPDEKVRRRLENLLAGRALEDGLEGG